MALTTSFITTFMGSVLNLAIPNIEGEFDSGAAAMGWIIVAYILSVSAFGVPFGRIADIYGRRKLLILGIGIFCISSLIASFSVNVEMLIIFRIMQEIFWGRLERPLERCWLAGAARAGAQGARPCARSSCGPPPGWRP